MTRPVSMLSLLALLAALSLAMALAPAPASAAPGERSFTPDSVFIPIREIGIIEAVSDNRVRLYECGPSDDVCMVDIADEAAVAALFTNPYTIAAGTYDRLYVSNCIGTGYNARLRGQALIAGTTYYTRAGADPLSTNATDLGYVNVDFNGCRKEYTLAAPLVLTGGDSFELGLVIALRGLAWAKLGPKVIPSGCVENAAQTRSVCMGYADIVPYVGDAASIGLERYLVGEFFGGTEPVVVGTVLLVSDTSGKLLAGFTRRAFRENSAHASGNFDTPFKTMTDLGGGNYYLENYGSTATGTGYVRFTGFRREDHTGTYLTQGGTSVNYITDRDYAAELPECPAGVLLTHSFVASVDEYDHIEPLGRLNPAGGHVFPTDHNYFYLNVDAGTGVPIVADIFFPGDGWVLGITESASWDTVPPADPSTPDHVDYSLQTAHCRALAMRYGHVQTLSPSMDALLASLKAASPGACLEYSTGGSYFRNCGYSTQTPVSAGQAIGSVGGVIPYYAWDLWTWDARIPPLTFANPSRFFTNDSGWDIFHIVCGLDYLAPAVRDPLVALIPRTAPPVCGTIEQDVPGTLQGVWFQPATSEKPEDPHLALVPDHIDPGKGVFSIGNSVPTLATGAYYFTPTTDPGARVNRDFSSVSDSQIYCYDNLTDMGGAIPNTTLLVRRDTATTLTIEKKPVADCAALGSPATWAFASNARAFER